MRSIFYILLISFLATSCETHIEPVAIADFLTLPTSSAENFTTVKSDSGLIEVIMTAPFVEQWENREPPFWEFKKGIRVDYYDKDTVPHGSVTAKYAKYDINTKIWTLTDSVVVINEDSDKMETELLNWNPDKDLIYTDRFVKITRIKTEEIIQGFGFESDSHLRRQKIRKVSATISIYVDEE